MILFTAYQSQDEPGTALGICTGIVWTAFLVKFTLFTWHAGSSLNRARKVLVSEDVNIPGKDALERVLLRHAIFAVTANSTTIARFAAIASMRWTGTLAIEFVFRYLDLANNVLTVVMMSGLYQSRPQNEEVVFSVVAVFRRLDEARDRISRELGYDIRPKMQTLAEAAWISQLAYTSVLRQVQDREGPDADDLINMESLYLFDTDPTAPLLPERMMESGKQVQELFQTATSLDQLRDEARTVQAVLKDKLAPGSQWARIGPEAAKMLRRPADGHFQLRSVDACYDPGVKSKERCLTKMQQKYEGNFNRIRDVARLALMFDTAAGILAVMSELQQMFDVVQVENRFATPTALGWADVTVLVRMPVQRGGNMTIHIAEIQCQLTAFYEARVDNHKHYRIIRSVLPELGVTPNDMDRVQNIILDSLNQ
jgi:hypothetical protein